MADHNNTNMQTSNDTDANQYYAPPRAAVADVDSNETNVRVEYDLRRWDIYLFQGIHQFLLPPVQIFCLLIAFEAYYLNRSPIAPFAAVVAYCAIWVVQLGFNVILLFLGKNHTLYTRHTVEIREDGFYEQTPYNRSLHYWTGGVTKVVSRPGFIALYTNAHQAHVIPSRAFADAAHRSGFLTTVRQRVAAGKSHQP